VIAAEPLLDVKGLCKHFPVYSKGFFRRRIGWVKAVDGVSFRVYPGQTLGLVGESGCGKTTTARTILRALEPTAGSVRFRPPGGQAVDLATVPSRQLKPLRRQMQMIFQDPFSSLNPRMTVGDIIGEPLRIHRVGTARQRKRRVGAMLEKVGLDPLHANRYPHAFSGGQRQRIGVARALILEPSLVVADEPVSALDVSVQAQVINLLEDLQDELHLTYVLVAHDLGVVRHICDHVAVMYAGRLVETGPGDAVFEDPRHPYTRALMAAIPQPDPDVKLGEPLGGEVADPANLPPGCPFHPRCAACQDPCRAGPAPTLREVETDHLVACNLVS